MNARNSASSNQWFWLRYQNSTPSASGDMARNFKNEGRRDIDPGIFQLNPIPNPARFLARESIQNTIDASRDTRFTDFHGDGPVEVVFRFRDLSGQEKRDFVAIAAISELSDRRALLQEGSAAAVAIPLVPILLDRLVSLLHCEYSANL